jgi:hypothetical protein
MRPELERLRRLEEHLLGETALLPLDATLPADLDLQRQLYAGLRQAGRQQLRRELAAIHERLYGPAAGRWTWAALAAGWRQVFVRRTPRA